GAGQERRAVAGGGARRGFPVVQPRRRPPDLRNDAGGGTSRSALFGRIQGPGRRPAPARGGGPGRRRAPPCRRVGRGGGHAVRGAGVSAQTRRLRRLRRGRRRGGPHRPGECRADRGGGRTSAPAGADRRPARRGVPSTAPGGGRGDPGGSRGMKVCMFVKNSFEYDARVTKEAKTLIDAGHRVTVIAYLVPGVTPEHEIRPDGIQVKRISRVNLGVDALNRLAARYAGTIEERHSRLTGEPVDVARARRGGRLQPPSTVAPSATAEVEVEQPVATSPPTRLSRAWGKVSTPVLRSVTKVARFGFRVVKALLGRQGRALKTLAINRRMIKAGLAE